MFIVHCFDCLLSICFLHIENNDRMFEIIGVFEHRWLIVECLTMIRI